MLQHSEILYPQFYKFGEVIIPFSSLLTYACLSAMPSLRILNKDHVDLLLQRSSDSSVSPEIEIINLMAKTFAAFSHEPDSVQAPHRTTIQTPNHAVLFMPSRVEGMGTAMKVVSVPKNGKGGLPSTILVMNEATGELRAVVNAAALTAIRTAAGEKSVGNSVPVKNDMS